MEPQRWEMLRSSAVASNKFIILKCKSLASEFVPHHHSFKSWTMCDESSNSVLYTIKWTHVVSFHFKLMQLHALDENGTNVYVWQISFDVQFQIQSVTWHFQKNKNECQLTTFYSKMSPQFWVTRYFKKINILSNEYTILICNRQNKLSIGRKYPLVLHVSPNVEDGSPIHCIHFKPTKRDLHKSIKGLHVQLIAQVAFDCICLENPLSQIAILDEMSIIFLPKLHKFRPICVPFQIATTYAPSLKYRFVLTLMSKCFHKFQEFSLTHVTFFFCVLELQQYPFEPQFDICDSVASSLG